MVTRDRGNRGSRRRAVRWRALSLLAWAAAALGCLLPRMAPAQPAAAPDAVTVGRAPVLPAQFNGNLAGFARKAAGPSIGNPRPYLPRLPVPTRSAKTPTMGALPLAAAPAGPLAPMPAPIQSFAGLSLNDACVGGPCGAGWPPDANGDVGPNHYVLAVNDAVAIYGKTGTLLAAFTENELWSLSGSSPCNGNSSGDPVVLYDWLADRWVLAWFAFPGSNGPFYECIAASKTSDPVAGGWWLYPVRMDDGVSIPTGYLNDYAKFGLWHDCLYMGANEFDGFGPYVGVSFASFSRSDMYAGKPLTYSIGLLDFATHGAISMFPASNLGKGARAVQPGTPAYFVAESYTSFAFNVRSFTAGPNCGGGGVMSAPVVVGQGSYTPQGGNIVPQRSTPNKLDMIDDRIMQKVWYRRIGSAESLWVTHPVGAPGSGITAMQWAQLDVTGGSIAALPVQQQIFSPDSTLYRFMGSLAVDGQGNMALGYSISNSTTFPGIRYAGRLASDPANTLAQTETTLIAGGGSQTNNCGGGPCHRWGDYSAMSVDPGDDCTFWYVNEYYDTPANGASGNWHTRIGSFRFPSCVSFTSTTTVLASSINPSVVGMSVTFTAQVTGIAPTGTVGFTADGGAIAGCTAVPVVGSGDVRSAACTTGSLAAGTHAIVATYGGDASNEGSADSLSQVVNATGSAMLTVTVTNLGSMGVAGARVLDPGHAGLSLGNWTCIVTTPGIPGPVTTACGVASGSGPLDTTVALGANGAVTYSIEATASGSEPDGTVLNSATVQPPPGVINSGVSCVSTNDGKPRTFDPATGSCTVVQTVTVTP